MLRTLRWVTALMVLFCAVWAAAEGLHGPFHLVAGGLLIRSSDAWRPAALGLLALVGFAAAGGGPALGRLRHTLWRWCVEPNPTLAGRVALSLALLAFLVTWAFQATTCGGSDSSGYMSQAHRWLTGTTTPALPWATAVPWPNAPWTFTPLGYTPSLAGPYRMAPIYAPGLPWLLAGAALISPRAGMSVVEPMCCAVLVLAACGIGRRLRGPWTGLLAAWLVATSPIVLFTSMTAMSDLPAGAAWGAAFYLLLGSGAGSAVGAGLMAGAATTIRPNLALLAGIMAVWFVVRPADAWSRRLRDLVLFGLGVLPGVLAVAATYNAWYGSPLESGYGSLTQYFDRAHIWPNLVGYADKAFQSEPVLLLSALVGLGVPTIWAAGRSRRAMAVATLLVAAVTAEYAAYLVFGEWPYLRFFLVIWALVGVAAAGALARLVPPRPSARAVAVVAVCVLGCWSVNTARTRQAFEQPWDRHYAAVASIVSEVVPARAVVFSFQHSGSLRYYSGRLPVRWDLFDGAWLDRAVAWLSAQGVSSYAVLESWELEDFREHFRGQRTLDGTAVPIIEYHGYGMRSTVFIYNLSRPPESDRRPAVIDDTDPSKWRNWPAGPEPTLTLTAEK